MAREKPAWSKQSLRKNSSEFLFCFNFSFNFSNLYPRHHLLVHPPNELGPVLNLHQVGESLQKQVECKRRRKICIDFLHQNIFLLNPLNHLGGASYVHQVLQNLPSCLLKNAEVSAYSSHGIKQDH